ncbi:MAG: Calx-beta domain-containing protein, partial [Singulisphaera sp.]|nr:Calx-beta domain-containing protein [Singulisphaera sp.]
MLPATFTVTDTSDDINDTGSLRHAITQSNLTGPGPNTINFNIPGTGVKTIAPLSALPVITNPVIIDGTSQPGFTSSPLIELDGQSAGTGSYGLAITAGGSTVEGLVINRFSESGIVIEGGGGNSIVGNLIGTDSSGLQASGNSGDGVFILNSPNNTVGGTTLSSPNVISGNSNDGIQIS